ncbi:MAG: hypothetical protein UZ16_OP3001001475 [Candidatus Hinthialibacteria bacterium OLB16]|nr:MAG: hypothetical protein UZ16_OP3001001475 [Candidatus Hinthialibacteria bacterium OLB16]
MAPENPNPQTVIRAKAGIYSRCHWIPAFAGKTMKEAGKTMKGAGKTMKGAGRMMERAGMAMEANANGVGG